MKPTEATLTKKLTVVLVLKLAVLLALWLCFVREQRVTVDAERAALQLLQPIATPAKGLKS